MRASVVSRVRAAMLLSRTPIVTPEVPAFDAAYYAYHEELERRLMWTFPKWFYFKKGTVSEREFTEAQKYPIPNNPSVWFPEGRPDLMHNRDRRFKEEVVLPKRNQEDAQSEEADLEDISRPIVPQSRVTAADKAGDVTSLERKLDQTLYLAVQSDADKSWQLPTFDVTDSNKTAGLHGVAEAGLRELGGDRINTWTVSNTPAGVLDGAVFVIKSHIVAGQFQGQPGCFQWVSKPEMEALFDKKYYAQIAPLLYDN